MGGLSAPKPGHVITAELVGGLAWKPVQALVAHLCVQDKQYHFASRLVAVVRFHANWFGVVRAYHDGIKWNAVGRSANDEGALTLVMKGLHPSEAEHLKIESFFDAGAADWVCQRCGGGGEANALPTEVRIGVKLKFSATLCETCCGALVSMVRPFLREVPDEEAGPRNILV